MYPISFHAQNFLCSWEPWVKALWFSSVTDQLYTLRQNIIPLCMPPYSFLEWKGCGSKIIPKQKIYLKVLISHLPASTNHQETHKTGSNVTEDINDLRGEDWLDVGVEIISVGESRKQVKKFTGKNSKNLWGQWFLVKTYS
jgi:hypothetical protein